MWVLRGADLMFHLRASENKAACGRKLTGIVFVAQIKKPSADKCCRVCRDIKSTPAAKEGT